MVRPTINDKPKLAKVEVRLSDETKAKLEAAQTIGVYKLTATQVIERGIELAWRELKEPLEEQGAAAALEG